MGNIVFSINDEEATRLFKKSRKLEAASKPFTYIGGILIGFPICSEFAGGDFNAFVFSSGCVFAATGIVLAVKSDRERFKSVERYNQVLKEEWGLFFQYMPEKGQLGLRFSYSF